jgi:type I restriction enzyme S subunit
MSYLEKLLNGVEVEWKTLGEVAELKRGTSITKNTSKEGQYPVISGGQKPAYYIEQFNREGETITIAGSGAYAGYVMYWNEPIFVSDAFSIKANEMKALPRYIFHFLLSIQEKIHNLKSGGGVPHVYAKDVARFQIPIPPLSVQKEIVRILDSFTELTAELTARKKQYNYYREKLLSFEGVEVEWKALGEVCTIGDGLHGTPEYNDNGEYYFINGNNLDNGRIIFNDRTKKVDDVMYNKYGIDFTIENTIFLSINGTIGSVSFYNNEKIVLGKSVAFFNIKSSELNSKYLYYFLQTNYSTNYFESQKTGSTIKNLGLKALRTFHIPIPPIAEQARIVSILDKFDILTTSISEGLPKEIELRKKQYEYYRDLLLTFPKNKIE